MDMMKFTKTLITGLLFSGLFATGAFAQNANFARTPVDYSAAVAATATTITIPAGGNHRTYFFLQNLSTTASIYCTYDGTTPTVGGLGTFYYGPGQFKEARAPYDYVPQGNPECISSSGSVNVTVKVYQPTPVAE